MAKNELFPFADGEDANVLPTNQWEALTDILENGFQSGIARSEQVNRVLAQGAVASYVLGQLIVDQLNKDATLDKNTLYQNLVSALKENAKDACLPLDGGTLLGAIKWVGLGYLQASDTTKGIQIYGGTAWGDGSFIGVYGKDHSSRAGQLYMSASDGTNTCNLVGRPDGILTWGSNTVSTYDLNGRVTEIYSNSNGLDTGDITLSQPYTNFKALCIVSGSDDIGYQVATEVISVWELQQRIAIGKRTFNIVDNRYFWECNTSTSTTTKFSHNNNDCRIYKIWGIK